MPKKHPLEVRDRSVRMVLDRLANYPSVSAACRDLAPKLNIGTETLRKWVMVAQADDGVGSGPTTVQPDEIKALKRKVKDLEETNESSTTWPAFERMPAVETPKYRKIRSALIGCQICGRNADVVFHPRELDLDTIAVPGDSTTAGLTMPASKFRRHGPQATNTIRISDLELTNIGEQLRKFSRRGKLFLLRSPPRKFSPVLRPVAR